MKCNRPGCVFTAKWIPIIKLPTIRTNEDGEFVKQEQPSLLLMAEVCEDHKEYYNLEEWIDEKNWKEIQEEARKRGRQIEERRLMEIIFRPIGWKPDNKWMELERNVNPS